MSLNQLKRKITSIKSTAKITNAMSLIATTKLKKQRELYERNKAYFREFYQVIGYLLHELEDQNILYVENPKEATLHININSTMGLCGAYNSSFDEYVIKTVKPQDQVFQFGKQGIDFWSYQTKLPNLITREYDFGEMKVPYTTCLKIANLALAEFWKGNVNKICVSFMRFINVLTAKPITMQILPFDPNLVPDMKFEKLPLHSFEFIPDRTELLKMLIPDYVANVLYGALIEAKVSEFALRRNAMETATKNADQLGYQYKLQYNNARQAQITTEIVEIVSSSNALPPDAFEEEKDERTRN